MGHKSVSHFLTLRLIMKSRVSTPLGAVPLIFGLTIGLILPYLFRTPRNCENLHPAEEPQLYNPLSRPSRKLLFVGVITADQFLETRARAVYETWGQSLPGSIAFFSSENSTSSSVPVVSLSGIDDVYPPQKKSLTMLKYMYDHLVDKYDWFMRCDDDVYVRTDKLSSFLLKLNSSEELYIGQPGVGLNKERGRLGLAEGENFCMGGPGVIISRMTLRRLGPLISTCLGQFASSHEDVEVGRCIRLATGISCTWAFEDAGVGKSCLLQRFMTDRFDRHMNSTVGAAFVSKTLLVGDNAYKIQIWDTAGQERYRSLAVLYYRGAQAVILVYDITRKETLDNISFWVEELKQKGPPNCMLFLCGNKADLFELREVSTSEGQQFAGDIGAKFIETSAVSALNIVTLFQQIAEDVVGSGFEMVLKVGRTIADIPSFPESTRRCC